MTIDFDLPPDPYPHVDNGCTLHFDYMEPATMRAAPHFDESANFKAHPHKLPRVFNVFEHHSKGLLYLVIGYNNLESSNPEHPPMVEYVGVNGNKWSKPLSTWFQKMKPSDRAFVFNEGCEPTILKHVHSGMQTAIFPDQRGRTHA